MVSIVSPGAMRPPPTPLSKHSTISKAARGLKRDRSCLDADNEEALLTSPKRPRVVAFADNVDVRILDDWRDKSLDLVKEEVRLGIERHLAPGELRDDTQYVKLLQLLSYDVFSAESPSTALLKKYVVALAGRVSQLRDCGKLVLAALDLSWLGRDQTFVELYTRLLVLLASASARYVAPITDRLVAHLEQLPASSGRLPGEDAVSQQEMTERLFHAISALLQRVPSAGSALRRSIKHYFPTDIATAKAHLRYQRHLLRLAEELPELKNELLSFVVERVVHLDVQIQRELEDFELEDDDGLLHSSQPRPAAADGDDSDDGDDDSVSESELTMDEDEQRLRDVRLKVAKMDGTQDLLFEYFSATFLADTAPQSNETYQQLLSHFDSHIMPNRSRHAQFLLFHFSQTSPAYAQCFAEFLQAAINDREATGIRRLTAAAYLASFVARAAHIERALVQSVFSWLCSYTDLIRNVWEPNCVGPDRRAYSLYYALAQALLYIFCFRWRDLLIGGDEMHAEDVLAEGHDLVWAPGIKESLTRSVHSVLNPLKVCNPAIVTEFAKISNHLRFIYVFTLLERNKRVRLGQLPTAFHTAGRLEIGRRETAFDRKAGEAHHQLEAYFPFDPYQLPSSKRWLDGEYNAWRLPRGMQEDGEGDDEDDDNDNDDDDEEEEVYDSDADSVADDGAVSVGQAVLVSS